MATCVQHTLKIYKNFTLQHLCYPIVHIYLCLTSIYHILLKLSCPYSWLIKQTKQTITKTTIKKKQQNHQSADLGEDVGNYTENIKISHAYALKFWEISI